MNFNKYYKRDIKPINAIEFSIYTNKNVKSYSATSDDPQGIKLAESYNNFEPKKGGLVDLRMGTCDNYLACTTCGQNSTDCPGHFGHTVLSEPVFNYGFMNHLKNILQCICLKCSNLLIDKTDTLFKKALNKKTEHRFKEIKSLSKNISYCNYCGVPVPLIKKDIRDNGSIKIMIERNITTNKQDVENNEDKSGKLKESLSARECYNILKNVSDNDCFLLGFNPVMQRPEDLIIENFPIAPVNIRPTSKVDFLSSATMEDSLTLKISDIINTNNRLRHQLQKENSNIDMSAYNQDIYKLLQYHVAIFYDNETLKLPQTLFKTGGRPTKSISERIKGKGGRVRSNLMAKRVDFSARTVITSDPYIDIDEVGVPKSIAMEITIPEEVTSYNIKYLSQLVKNGRDIYPGANYVIKTNNNDDRNIQKIELKYRKKTIRLNIGDIVERHSINGDYVLFNRQPTLHKPSMMGHRIQVIDNDNLNTFRMNVSVTKPYGADFDGDEMNMFLAQSIQARNELKMIANVKYQIIGTKDSSPIIGGKDDTLSGAYVLTSPNVKIPGWELANILCNTSSQTKYNINMDKTYTGHEAFSYIIPEGINNVVYNSSGGKKLEIINGKLIEGYLDKSALSFQKNSIIQFIWDKHGPNKTCKFIDDSQRLVLNYLLTYGESVGFKDAYIDEKMQNIIKTFVDNKLLESTYNITQYENEYDVLSVDSIEKSLFSDLSIVQGLIGDMIKKYYKPDNFLLYACKSGAKGSENNLAQISGCISQGLVEGARIKKKIEERSLVYFHANDDTPEARGFIKNSFLLGLKGYESFYNSFACREGLIDTAIKSVTRDTPIIIIENNQPKYVQIGEWIDNILDNNKENIKHEEYLQMELFDLENKVYIPTMDYDGKVTWGDIVAITRHDPGEVLYEIKTSGGRNVTVTASKSLLIWNNITNQFKEVLTSEIKVGDFVPVTLNLCNPPVNIKYTSNKFYEYAIENNINDIHINSMIYESDNEEDVFGYAMLCSRKGIYGTFSKLNNKFRFTKSNNFKQHNDVVLDEITEIKLIDTKNHKKVYDLTIPSTFNFGLANGLQVRDTAQTGYIARQLIKALEDLSIKYDGTNRNANNTMIQLVYGENGINQSIQSELHISLVNMNNKTVNETFGFTSNQIKKLSKSTKTSVNELTSFNKQLINKMMTFRDELRKIQAISLQNYKIVEEKYFLPVNLLRITQFYSKKADKEFKETDLSPIDIVDEIENFLNDSKYRIITFLKPSDKYTKQDDRDLKYLFSIGLYEYISPVKCIYKYGLTKSDFMKMMDEIKLNFLKALIEPGEMVGVLAAQSVGEPTSQLTLNTKHFAGVAGKTSASMGLTRILELLHYSKNIKMPMMNIYFDKVAHQNNLINKITSHFKFLTINDLISNIEIYYSVDDNNEQSKLLKKDNVSIPFFVNNIKSDINSMPFVIRIKLDLEKMMDKEITLLDIKTKFINYWYKNFTNLKTMKKQTKDIISKINKCAIISNNLTDKEQIIHIRFNMINYNYSLIIDFMNIILSEIKLKGIDYINNVDVISELYKQYDEEGNVDMDSKEKVAITDGINFENMRMIKHIDHTRTRCNDIYTILRLYGIEAVRQILIYEFYYTFKEGNSNININHLSLLVDYMCHTGDIISIDRHGLSKLDLDPISKASFEETMGNFVTSAIFNQKDSMKSLSSRIALGRVFNGGTGCFELLLDTQKLINLEYTNKVMTRITFTPLEEDPLIKDILTYNSDKKDFYIPN
jgi:DNA-directed RNA polymerase beta' subunit